MSRQTHAGSGVTVRADIDARVTSSRNCVRSHLLMQARLKKITMLPRLLVSLAVIQDIVRKKRIFV
jgi:hypothetical protein